MPGRIDPISHLILSQEIGPPILPEELGPPIPEQELGPPILSQKIGPLLTSQPIGRRTRPEALRRTMAARAVAVAPWVAMSPAEIRAHPAIADKPASREIKDPLAAAAKAAAVVAEAAVMPDAAAVRAVAVVEEIEAARGRVIEEFL
jgi:hypothetical protein